MTKEVTLQWENHHWVGEGGVGPGSVDTVAPAQGPGPSTHEVITAWLLFQGLILPSQNSFKKNALFTSNLPF